MPRENRTTNPIGPEGYVIEKNKSKPYNLFYCTYFNVYVDVYRCE